MIELLNIEENSLEDLIINELKELEKSQEAIRMKQDKIVKLVSISLGLVCVGLAVNLILLFILLFV